MQSKCKSFQAPCRVCVCLQSSSSCLQTVWSGFITLLLPTSKAKVNKEMTGKQQRKKLIGAQIKMTVHD